MVSDDLEAWEWAPWTGESSRCVLRDGDELRSVSNETTETVKIANALERMMRGQGGIPYHSILYPYHVLLRTRR